MPRTPKQSARFGVSLISMLASGKPRYSLSAWPIGASSGSSNRPDASLSRPSSLAEHSMPLDSTPRSLAALIAMPPTWAPTSASGATSPARAFGAPQTICSKPPCPASTWHTCSRSASGCRTASTMRATTTCCSDSPSGVTSSTSRPMAVRVAANSSREAWVGTWLRSQFSENFMNFPGLGTRDPGLGCQNARTRGTLTLPRVPSPESRVPNRTQAN